MGEPLLTKEEMNIIDCCKSYPYIGKRNDSPIFIWIVSVIILLFVIAYIIYEISSGKTVNFGFIVCFSCAIIFGYIIKKMQFDAMKILTQYFRDENGMYYKIQFTKVSTQIVRFQRVYSLMPLVGEVKTLINAYEALKVKDGLLENAYEGAQSKILAYYYVKRFKQGYQDWDVYNGGAAKVIPLGKITHIEKNKYESILNGERKVIKIPDVYGSLEK